MAPMNDSGSAGGHAGAQSGTTWEASAWTSSSYSTRAARPDARDVPNFDDLPLTRLNPRKPCGHSVYHFCSLPDKVAGGRVPWPRPGHGRNQDL